MTVSVRYPGLDQVEDLAPYLNPGLQPHSPGSCYVLLDKSRVTLALRVRVDRQHPDLPERHIVNPGAMPNAFWPLAQKIDGGFIGSAFVRFDWGANGRISLVTGGGVLADGDQIVLDSTTLRSTS